MWETSKTLLKCYYLSLICLIAPIVFSGLVFKIVTPAALGIDLVQVDWTPTIIKPGPNAKIARPLSAGSPNGQDAPQAGASNQGKATETGSREAGSEPTPSAVSSTGQGAPQAGAPNAANASVTVANSKTEEPSEDLTIRPLVRQLVGRLNYAAVWSFYLVICSAAIAVALYVLKRFVGLGWWLALIVGCVPLAFLMNLASGWENEAVRAKFLVSVLSAADKSDPYLGAGPTAEGPTAQAGTGLSMSNAGNMQKFKSQGLFDAAHVNTLLGLYALALMLIALAVISKLPENAPSLKDLRRDAESLRLLLYAASALFVISLIANKLYVDLPPQLVKSPTDAAVRAVLNAQLAVWSTSFTIVLITAFGPAFAAWFSRHKKLSAESPAERARLIAQDSDKGDAALEIVPMSTLAGILSVLAPLAASPVFDALQKLLGAVPGAK